MTVTYYLNSGRNKNLYCRIGHGSKRVSLSLSYRVEEEYWDTVKEEIKTEDPKYYILRWLKRYINNRFKEIEGNSDIATVLAILKSEVKELTEGINLDGLEKKRWELENRDSGVHDYEDFIIAIEEFTGNSIQEVSLEVYENSMRFVTKEDIEYEIDTWEGLRLRLIEALKNKNYDELYVGTEPSIWKEIYEDPGIEKSKFLPVFLREWEDFWRYSKDTCHPQVYPRIKEESWRKFMVFMNCYDSTHDIFGLANSLSDIEFIPLIILTTCRIYDLETCLSEYSEYYFQEHSYGWKTIDFGRIKYGDDVPLDDESPMFYIRESEI